MNILCEQDLNELVSNLAGQYGFPQDIELTEAVATVILHAPPDMGSFNLVYIGERVGKMLANRVAYDKIQALKEQRKQAETPKEVPASGPIQDQKVS